MTDEELQKVVFTDIFNKRRESTKQADLKQADLKQVPHGLFFKIAFTVLGLLAVISIMPFMVFMGVVYGLVGAYEALVGIKKLWFK
ncbi:MAG: hypothetical protein ACPHUD_10775 [Porticoccaceae bacterium]